MNIKPKYKKTLSKYLKWIEWNNDNSSALFRPPLVTYNPNGESPDVIMYKWETHGIKVPEASNDPELLSMYIQGKTLRDWHITEWRRDIKEGLFLKEEFKEDLEYLGEDINIVFKGINEDITWYKNPLHIKS